jgi:TFIIF-interacting CTD phosphatase-like protein
MKHNVILDLDQTLISAESSVEFDLKKNKEKAAKFTYKDMDGYYTVFERPGLQKFLDFLFNNFNVSIWTAASKDYALFIVDNIILNSDRKLDWIFFSYHCDISKRLKSGTKDLRIIWEDYEIPGYSKDNTVIIDDYDEVYKTQPSNCIIALPFEFTDKDSHKDKFLDGLEKELTKMKLNKNEKPAESVNKALKSKTSSNK